MKPSAQLSLGLRSKNHSIRIIAAQLRVGTGTVYKVLEVSN